MSNHLAVANVTAALGRRAHTSAAGALDAEVDLQFGRPVAPSGDNLKPTLHVYLYQVTPNAALRNADLPTRDSAARLNNRPRAAVDLHYLLTFYGEAATLVPERMMAAVVRDLHAHAYLEAGFVRSVANGADHQELQDSDLAAARELVKFTPAQLTLEEMSRLWSIMVQSPYALTIAYHASVIELEALESGPAALPVLKRGQDDRGVETALGPFPQFDSWWSGPAEAAVRMPRPPSFPAAQLGDRLLLSGSTLGGDTVIATFTHARLAAAASTVIPAEDRTATELRITIPDDAGAQDQWAAGIYTVVARVTRGGEQRSSNAMPLIVAPRITAITPNPAARDPNGDVTFTISCHPKVLPGQRPTLLFGTREIDAVAFGPTASATVDFNVTDVTALTGELLRLRVDGVPSLPFRYDAASATFVFDPSQRVTIT